jgi:hypothetical protein
LGAAGYNTCWQIQALCFGLSRQLFIVGIANPLKRDGFKANSSTMATCDTAPGFGEAVECSQNHIRL